MKLKILRTYSTALGIKQETTVLENILTLTDIDNSLIVLSKNGESGTAVLDLKSSSVTTKIEILSDGEESND